MRNFIGIILMITTVSVFANIEVDRTFMVLKNHKLSNLESKEMFNEMDLGSKYSSEESKLVFTKTSEKGVCKRVRDPKNWKETYECSVPKYFYISSDEYLDIRDKELGQKPYVTIKGEEAEEIYKRIQGESVQVAADYSHSIFRKKSAVADCIFFNGNEHEGESYECAVEIERLINSIDDQSTPQRKSFSCK